VILGHHNCATITQLDLENDFNDWILERSLVQAQELKAFESKRLANQLKPYLTSPPNYLRINRKNVPQFDVPNICNWLLTTNSESPLAIEESDRRFFFYFSPCEDTRTREYWRDYYAWCKANAGAVMDYLLQRDLSDFYPKAAPPMTRSKRVLIETSKPLIYQHLKSLLAEGGLRDLETMDSMIKKLPAALQRTSPQQIGETLKELGGRRLRQVRLRKGRQHLWATRRPELYESLSDGVLAEKFDEIRAVGPRDVVRR
jgi:hypothetical protein